MRKTIIFAGLIAGVAGINGLKVDSVQAAPSAVSGLRVERVERTSIFAPGTVEHAAVAAWLARRSAEGQFPVLPGIDVTQLGVMTVTRSILQTSPVGDGNVSIPSVVLPDPSPGQLPETGKEGDTYSYSSCTAGGASYTYTYKWDPSANGGKGGWVITKIAYQAFAQTCN